MSRDREAWEEGPCDPDDWYYQREAKLLGELRAIVRGACERAGVRYEREWWEWPVTIVLTIAVLVAAGLLMALIPDSWYLSDHWPM